MDYIIVAFFAFFGGNARYLLGLSLPVVNGFPLGTLVANLLGCFLFSWLVKHIMADQDVNGRLILGVGTGFFGAFTTFSSFALDTVKLFETNVLLAGLYLTVSIFGGILMAYLGEKVWRPKPHKEDLK
ncbi:CrcB family protein [Enterococcus sp. MJM12]|uniref:Fluoride-specific ion channel FluC n=1 Tax=Candidatus Enterococcus myersii TaxID=2815322 RepID=A0ABS3H9H9_9ENTE|nr:CrcB family protein [Enterococcus sp. MJM12]